MDDLILNFAIRRFCVSTAVAVRVLASVVKIRSVRCERKFAPQISMRLSRRLLRLQYSVAGQIKRAYVVMLRLSGRT